MGGGGTVIHKSSCSPKPQPPPREQEDAYQGPCSVSGAVPPWLRGTLYRVGPGLWEVGGRQLRHLLDGFVVVGATAFGGPGEGVSTQQRLVANEPYRAARRGSLIVDKFASRRRFAGWGDWAQERIRVSCKPIYSENMFPGSRHSSVRAPVCTPTPI